MKHVNGDMEDLFRRAAERYPLRTDSADWDRLSASLDKDPGPPSDGDADEKRRRRGIFWWWLLLPLVGALGFYGWRATVRPSTHLSKANTITAPATNTAPGATASVTTPAGKAVASTGGEQGGGAAAGGTTAGGTQAGVTTGAVSSGDGVASAEKVRPAGATSRGAGSGEKMRATGPGEKTRATGSTFGGMGTAGGKNGGSTTSDANNDRFDAAKIGGGVNGGGANGNGINGGGIKGRSMIDSRRASTAGNFSLEVDVKAPAAGKDSSAKQVKKATAKSSHGHGYIGLSGAPDVSTVKMQAAKGVGTTWGLLLGYAFNDRWAVESGVYLDRKKYYSAGEYFNKSGDPDIYNGETIKNVNGTCNMWEIPVNVRYNFNPGAKITWFATAGFSSYFMTKQQYTTSVEANGSAPWNDNWSTTVPSNYLFSIINLSGGFEQRIGSIGNLRIEPYLRIPLSGIGSGKLPIMSAGLSIGITRRLW